MKIVTQLLSSLVTRPTNQKSKNIASFGRGSVITYMFVESRGVNLRELGKLLCIKKVVAQATEDNKLALISGY